MSNKFKREERYIVVKLKHLAGLQVSPLRNFLRENRVPTIDCVVIESDWPEYEPAWKMIEARMTGTPESQQSDARQVPAPSGITWRADGDANVYTMMRDGNWLASIRMNGELHTFQQEVLLSQFVGAEPSKSLEQWQEWGAQASAEIDRLQDIEVERDTLRAQLAERDALLLNAWECDIPTPLKRDIRAALSTTAKPEVQS